MVRQNYASNVRFCLFKILYQVTVFSAPNYCGEFDNNGGVLEVGEDMKCGFKILKPLVAKPDRVSLHQMDLPSGMTPGMAVYKPGTGYEDLYEDGGDGQAPQGRSQGLPKRSGTAPLLEGGDNDRNSVKGLTKSQPLNRAGSSSSQGYAGRGSGMGYSQPASSASECAENAGEAACGYEKEK